MNEEETDGASIPEPIRWLISVLFPSWVLVSIDIAGVLHDHLYFKIPKKESRRLFEKEMKMQGIKLFIKKDSVLALVRSLFGSIFLVILRKIIVFGLFVYDISPKKLKLIAKKSVKKRTIKTK